MMTPQSTALHRNAFFLLGATVRDGRQQIAELAEERLLELDHAECARARSELLNPRLRLSAELSWLPGVSPKRASQLVERLLTDPAAARAESGLPKLARANILAASLEASQGTDGGDGMARWILELAQVVAEVDPGDVLRDINEDRTVARFASVMAEEQVAQELAERGRYYRSVVRAILDRLESRQLVAVMTEVVEGATSGGEDPAPSLIDDLVSMFELDAQQFLEREAENIAALVEAIRAAAPRGEAAVSPLISKLEAVVRSWDSVAQPIQLVMRSRGTDHELSNRVSLSIRDLGVDLFNRHQMLGQAKRITALLQEVFAELPELAERLDGDADALDEIEQTRERARAQSGSKHAEWARDISYRTEIGVVFKDVLRISPDGVSWRDRTYPLDAVTRVRWGAIRQAVSGITAGTTFTIAFGDAKSEAVVECRREDVFDAFVPRLWKAVGVRLLVEALETVREGHAWTFGGVVLRDETITIQRHNFLTREPVQVPWSGIRIWSADGSLNIVATDDQKVSASLPYIHTENAHVLEHLLQMTLRQPGLRRLSDLLSQ